MKKSLKIIIFISSFILLLIISLRIFKYHIKREDPQICCNNNCFNVEIAANNKSRQLWLMYRESLPENNWMLFVFDEPWTYSFWMKNTLIPLAWIRMDSNFKIVDIIQMNPCDSSKCTTYTPKYNAQYVLEINQRLISEKWLLHIWDKCELK